MIDWTKVIEQTLAQAPAIIVAAGAAIYKLSKIEKRQVRIEHKVNGNHRVTMKAIRAQGQLEGIKAGKQIVREDMEHATKVIAKANSRGRRRSTDK